MSEAAGDRWEPVAAFMTNPVDSAIVNANGAIRQGPCRMPGRVLHRADILTSGRGRRRVMVAGRF
jgi:hypothetical protein